MNIAYIKLWNRTLAVGIKNKTSFIPTVGISSNILAKLSKCEFISMKSRQKICNALNCDEEIVCAINKPIEGK